MRFVFCIMLACSALAMFRSMGTEGVESIAYANTSFTQLGLAMMALILDRLNK